MPERIAPGETYEDIGAPTGGYTHEAVFRTNTGRNTIWVCDCHGPRVVFKTAAGADAHEDRSAAGTSLADMGIYPGLGEEVSDYLPGRRSHNRRRRSY